MSAAKGLEYRGGCHCGAVRFIVRADLDDVVECNCSVCTRKGFLHLLVEREAFELLTPADALRTYTFGTHVAKHHFCARCGIASFYVPRSHPGGISVNARCLDDVDPKTLRPRAFDGQRWEENIAALKRGAQVAPSD